MKTHCPTCNTEMEEFESRCPACLRERTRAEIFAAGKKPASAGTVASQGRFGGLFWILFGLVAMALSFHLLSEKKLQDADIAAGKKLAEVELKLKQKENRQQAEENEGRTDDADEDEDEDSITIISPSSHDGRTAQTTEAPLPKDAPSAWVFQGEIYDLIQLTPVRGVRLTFENRNSGKLYRTKSNSKGRYKVRVPKIDRGGYILKIRHRNYDGIYLEDINPPYKQRGVDQRLETLESFSQMAILHVPLLPEKSEKEIRHDLVLLPR